MNLIKYSKELTIDFNQRYIIQRRENHGDWKAYNQFLPKVQVESDCLFINIADMLHAIIYSQGEKPLALKILGLKINARVTFRVIAVSLPSCFYFVLMMLVIGQGEHDRGEFPQHALIPLRPGHRGGDG